MIIKNYHSPMPSQPALDLQIIEDVTDVLVHAGCIKSGSIGDLEKDGVTSVYGSENAGTDWNRFVDFTKQGVRCRLIVTNWAYVCNDDGKMIEKVSS